ncbi:MAG: arginine--tRNA ligase [Planctomycetes bacterium]|nr:arginine--tRNA ligase [Planctomycetota bacterium]
MPLIFAAPKTMPMSPIEKASKITAALIERTARELYGEGVPNLAAIESALEAPRERDHGHLAYPCFGLAKLARKAPAAVASAMSETIGKNCEGEEDLDSVESVAGFLNFRISAACLRRIVGEIHAGDFLAPLPDRGEKVMVEYSQPNTHKVFHVGHMRNAALGDALARLYHHAGFSVVAANYYGDVGAHIAECLWSYKNEDLGVVPGETHGELLGRHYCNAKDKLDLGSLTTLPHPGIFTARVSGISAHPRKDEWKRVRISTRSGECEVVCGGREYKVGDVVAHAAPGSLLRGRLVQEKDMDGCLSMGAILSEKELGTGNDANRIHVFAAETEVGVELTELGRRPGVLAEEISVSEAYSRRRAEVSAILKALEAGEEEICRMWRETRQWSLDEFTAIYEWLDCHFDCELYESEVGDGGKEIVMREFEKGILVRSEGAIGADLSRDKLGFCMLLKSDGTGLYSTKDLCLAHKKFAEYGIDRSIYVVADEQSLHFKQIFKTLELMGYEQAGKCVHLPYGLVVLPEGKMSSRKGNVIAFSKLRSMLASHIREEFFHPHEGIWPEEEIAEAVRWISVATIRYGMLNQDNNKQIIFDMKEWTALTGNTGPYLLYACARIRSIGREVEKLEPGQVEMELLEHPSEAVLLHSLCQFRKTVERAAEQNRPQLMCIYLYDLARDFSRMYEQCPVKNAETAALRSTRLALVSAVGKTLETGLGLIGIHTLDRM